MRVRTDLDVAGPLTFLDGIDAVETTTWSTDTSKTISTTLTTGVKYKVVVSLIQNTSAGYLYGRFNNNSTNNYLHSHEGWSHAAVNYGGALLTDRIPLSYGSQTFYVGFPFICEITFWGNTVGDVGGVLQSSYVDSATAYPIGISGALYYYDTNNLNRFDLYTTAGTCSGTVTLYTLKA